MTQQMYSYGGGVYRFISYRPIKVGEAVFITGRLNPVIVEEVLEVRPDKGDWNIELHSVALDGTETVSKATIFSNMIKIKDENVSNTV